MGRLFGTDGVRGVANVDLTAELAMGLGRAAATFFAREHDRPRLVMARDTRISGDMLEGALTSGLTSAGADVLACGILPTPAVAFLVSHYGADAGVVISGSHNPVEDNGIKFFGPDGFKLSDQQESEIEALLDQTYDLPAGVAVGRTLAKPDSEDRYIEHCLGALEGRRLDGLNIVVDCAYGAAFSTSPRALSEAGAEVIALNANPDGDLINVECGSTAPEVTAKAVVESGADIGLAHDGDADRVIAVDENGGIVDGDAIMSVLSVAMKETGTLRGNLVVATVMSNLGFKVAMRTAGIEVVETSVGDRYVLEAMRERGASLGGEQSGHVVLLDHATTGDGLITGLRLAARVAETGRRLSDLTSIFTRYPQVLLNVKVADKSRLDGVAEVWKAVESAEKELGEGGRVLVRPSGTEALIRVMVEAIDETTAGEIAHRIAAVIKEVMSTKN